LRERSSVNTKGHPVVTENIDRCPVGTGHMGSSSSLPSHAEAKDRTRRAQSQKFPIHRHEERGTRIDNSKFPVRKGVYLFGTFGSRMRS